MSWSDIVKEQVSAMDLSHGGNAIQYEPVKVAKSDKPVLVIGLGGTGLRIVRATKDMFMERFTPAVNPPQHIDARLPPTTRFLAIDTSDGDLTQMGLMDNEKVNIGVPGLGNQLLPSNRGVLPHYITDWLNPNVRSDGSGVDGANGIRQIGRFDLFQNVTKIITEIQTALADIKHGKGNIYVIIAAGTAGGTGAGTFLDIPYLVKHAASQLDIGMDRLRIIGYLVTPDVYSSLNLGMPTAAALMRSNGYASLKELDYWMGVQDRYEEFSQQYAQNITIRWDTPPFKDCILLSSMNVAGDAPQHAYELLRGVVAEYITNMFAKEEEANDSDKKADFGFSYTQYRDNVDSYVKNSTQKYPVIKKYTAIGATNGQIPWQELILQEGILLFEKIREIYDVSPNGFDESSFTALVDKVVQQDITNVFANVKGRDPRTAPVKQIRASSDLAPHSEIIDKVTRNYREALMLAGSQDMNQAIEKKAEDFIQTLITEFSTPEYGPFYTSRLIDLKPGLYEQESDGFAPSITGNYCLLQTLKARETAAKTDRDRQKAIYDQAVQRAEPEYKVIKTRAICPSQNGGTAKRYYTACEEAITALRQHYTKDAYARLYARMIEKLEYFNEHIVKVYVRILTELVRLYKSNERFTHTAEYRQTIPSYYCNLVPTQRIVEELSNRYMTSARNNDMLMKLFSDMMAPYIFDEGTGKKKRVSSEKLWLLHDERSNETISTNIKANLQRIVNRFFKEFNSKTLLEVWVLQYPEYTDGIGVLNVKAVIDGIGETLQQQASPMFIANNLDSINSSSNTVPYEYVTVPQNASGLAGAMQNNRRDIKVSAITDRIFWIKSIDAVSLYHYGPLESCEQDYITHCLRGVHYGTHLWESQVDKAKNWRYLPNALPRKARSEKYNNDFQTNEDERNIHLINDLMANNVIKIDPNTGIMHVYEAAGSFYEETVKELHQKIAEDKVTSDQAEAEFGQILSRRSDMQLQMDPNIRSTYQGADTELAYDMLLQAPALVRKAAKSDIFGPVRKAIDELKTREQWLLKFYETAARLADLLAFGILETKNKLTYEYQFSPETRVTFYHAVKDKAYSDKYHPIFGTECGVAGKLIEANSGESSNHGMHIQLQKMERDNTDLIEELDADVMDGFKKRASELKKALQLEIEEITAAKPDKLGISLNAKNTLIEFRKKMISQLESRAFGFRTSI
ncbi:MAG: tubulin-like doman-containing protein [Clostridia bacterium]|nr:tubulin-like doman-containing protein [Clostridia bacterium]